MINTQTLHADALTEFAPASITEATRPLPQPFMMDPVQIQKANEFTYSRKFIDNYLRYEITRNEELMESIALTVADIQEWLCSEFYDSKYQRLEVLRQSTDEQLFEIVLRLVIGCAYAQIPELFTSITGQLANRLGWDDKVAAITTVAELLVFLAQRDIIAIMFVDAGGEGRKYNRKSVAVQAYAIPISDALINYVRNSSYLPPMVCEPKTVKHNHQSGYLTHNDSVVLNSRSKLPVALDVINTQNKTALSIDLEFLLNVDDVPNKPLESLDQIRQWEEFKRQTNQFLLTIHTQAEANRELPGAIYFNHKFDQRGRMYCQGYHINYQGTPWRKALIEFAEVQYVEVPEKYRKSPT